MGKHGKYQKHYKPSWESLPEFSAWLTKNPDLNAISQEAYCTFCKTGLRAHKTDLKNHRETTKHRRFAASFVNQNKISSFGIDVVDDTIKASELKLAAFIATHCAVRSIDHLSEMMAKLGEKSEIGKIRLHRTKCSRLITNVISPVLLTELVEDIGDRPYSLIIDESTDVSISKYMATCIRYFSPKHKKIITDFLGIITITDASALSLYEELTFYLKSINLSIKNLISIGTDGASNMVGKNHSLFTLLRDNVPLPHLILIRCICHSLHLCSSKASDVLPSSLEFLIRESRNWFSNSSKRIEEYKNLFNLINNNDKKMLALIQLSDTRWLAWEGAVIRILDQWLELKSHFKMVAARKDNRCYTARQLAMIYEDPTSQLYLTFLKSILHDINEVNILFQSSNQDIYKLYEALWTLILSVCSRFIKPLFMEKLKATESVTCITEVLNNQLALKSSKEIDYGIEFQRLTCKCNSEDLNEVQKRCNDYLIILCKQLVDRMPNNFLILKMSARFTPRKILCTLTKPSINDLPLELLDDGVNLTIIESQIRNIGFVNWRDYFSEEIMSDTCKFWSNVYDFKDASGRQQFKELAQFALKVQSLPISNAVVERVFSVMNFVKTKFRNRMQFAMLTAILRIRIHFNVTNTCCTTFKPHPKMYELFNSKMYETPKATNVSISDEEQILDEVLTLFSVEEIQQNE